MELEGARGPSGGWEVGPSEDRPLGLGEGQQGATCLRSPSKAICYPIQILGAARPPTRGHGGWFAR